MKYAIIANDKLVESSPGIDYRLAKTALSLAKAGRLPNSRFKKDKEQFILEAVDSTWIQVKHYLRNRKDPNFEGIWIE